MLENAGQCDTGYISADASITFEYKDGSLGYRMSKTFDISDALFSKLKNMFVKMLFLWLQHFNREVMTNNLLAINAWPSINYSVEKKDSDQTELDQEKNDDGNFENDDADSENDGDLLSEEPEEEQPTLTGDDPLILEATKIVREVGSASMSLLQRRLKITFRAAQAIMDTLEMKCVVGPYKGSGARDVLPYVLEDVANA